MNSGRTLSRTRHVRRIRLAVRLLGPTESWLTGFPDEEARDDSDIIKVAREHLEMIADRYELPY